MFFQKDLETMPRAELEALQLQRLKRIVDYCYNNVPFYHERLNRAGRYVGRQDKNPVGCAVSALYHQG